MKLRSIQDMDNLASVLDVDAVSSRLIELVNLIRNQKIDAEEGAIAINDLIGFQGQNETGINLEASKVVFDWITKNYDTENRNLIEYQITNLTNLTCIEAKQFLEDQLDIVKDKDIRKELIGALSEIEIKT